MEQTFHATTIVAVRQKGKTAIAGDGQVTFGQSAIMKSTARKVRRLYHGKVVAGFAGSVADAFTLFEKFEAKLEEFNGNLMRRLPALPFGAAGRRRRGDRLGRLLRARGSARPRQAHGDGSGGNRQGSLDARRRYMRLYESQHQGRGAGLTCRKRSKWKRAC